MKKVYLLAACLAALASQVHAQGVKGGLKAGLNLAVVTNTFNTGAGFKPGVHFGGFLEAKMSEKASFQPELLYSGQGFTTTNMQGQSTGKVNLAYVSLPLLFNLYVGSGFHFTLGPQASVLVNAKAYEEGAGSLGGARELDIKDEFKTGELSLAGGLGYKFKGGINLSARYITGVTDINNNEFIEIMRVQAGAGKMYNRLFQFSAGFSF
jgi:opacity protein-like surface antigen